MSENNYNLKQEKNGSITFANDVVATIAGLAATEIDGIAAMSGGIIGGIAEMLGRKNLTKGVKVEITQDKVKVDLFVVVDYGVEIHKVCAAVQKSVKKAIETMTGLEVSEINVNVQGVRIEKPSEDVEEK
ncbi:MAG: Asp23/Gls24 family envelope stress response protein [Eubacteriales bacterium]